MQNAGTTGGALVELTAADGVTRLSLMVDAARDSQGNLLPVRLDEILSAAVADSPTADWLEPHIQETWIGGCGVPEIGYNQAPGCDTRYDGFALPGPAPTTITVPAANNTSTPIVAAVDYSGFIWIAQQGTAAANTARVFRAASGTTVFADHLNLGANNTITDLLVFDNGTGGKYLWASGNDAAGGRLHYFDGAVWNSTASNTFGANKRDWLAKVYWRTEDGSQGWRMVAGSGPAKISYTKPNTNPALAASWVEGVPIETASTIHKGATARRHLYVPAYDGLFDLDELGNTPNLTSYTERQIHPVNGIASYYQEGYVYMSLGTGLDRIYVGDGPLVQETVGQCGPGAFTSAEHLWGGWTTAITGDQGWVVTAVYNPKTLRTGIWWGRDRKYYPEVSSPNPMVWHGPMIVSNVDLFVTTLQTVANLTTNALTLIVGSTPYAGSSIPPTGGLPDLTFFTLPSVGQPLSDMLSGGLHRFASGSVTGNWQPYCRVESMSTTGNDKNSKKIVYQDAFGSRGLDVPSGTKLTTYSRADPAPGSTAWGTGLDVPSGPTYTVTPAAEVSGYKLEYRVDLFSPSGAATPAKVAVLDAVRRTWWRVVPAFRVLVLEVSYGDRTPGLAGGQDDQIDPDRTLDLLKGLTEIGRTTIRLPANSDKRFSVKLRQVMDTRSELTNGPHGKRCSTKLQIAVLAQV